MAHYTGKLTGKLYHFKYIGVTPHSQAMSILESFTGSIYCRKLRLEEMSVGPLVQHLAQGRITFALSRDTASYSEDRLCALLAAFTGAR